MWHPAFGARDLAAHPDYTTPRRLRQAREPPWLGQTHFNLGAIRRWFIGRWHSAPSPAPLRSAPDRSRAPQAVRQKRIPPDGLKQLP